MAVPSPDDPLGHYDHRFDEIVKAAGQPSVRVAAPGAVA